MDRAFGPVIAKVRVRFPVKPEIFSGFLSTAYVVHSTAKIMFSFITLLCYTIVGNCCHLPTTRASFHFFHWRFELSLVNFKTYIDNFCFFSLLSKYLLFMLFIHLFNNIIHICNQEKNSHSQLNGIVIYSKKPLGIFCVLIFNKLKITQLLMINW